MDFENDSEVTELTEVAHGLHIKAVVYNVQTHAQYAALGTDLQTNKGAQKRLAEKKKALMEPAAATLAAIRALFAPVEAQLKESETMAKNALLRYEREQAELAAEEQRKADEITRKEQARLAKIAADNAAKAELARQAGDEKKAAKYDDKAEAAEERSQFVVSPVMDRTPPKVAGISTRKTYSARVDNLLDLVKGVASGKYPLSYIEANMKVLNAQARTLQKEFECPGVTVVENTGMAAGSR